MYCPRCGAEIAKEAAFCPACGANLSDRAHHKPIQDGAGRGERFKGAVTRVQVRVILAGFAIIAIVAIAAIGSSVIFGEKDGGTAASSASGEAVATDAAENSDAEDPVASDGADGITMTGTADITTTTSDSLGVWPASISDGEVKLSNIKVEQCDVPAFPETVRNAVTGLFGSSDIPRFTITADAENMTVDQVEIELGFDATYNSKDAFGDWQRGNGDGVDLSLSWPEATEAYLAAHEKREVVFFLTVYPDKHSVEADPDSTWYYSDVSLTGISSQVSQGIVSQSDMDDAIELTGNDGVVTTADSWGTVSSRPSFRFTNTSDSGITYEKLFFAYRYDGNLLPRLYDEWFDEAIKPGESADFTPNDGVIRGHNYDDELLELVPLYCIVSSISD